MAKKTTPTKTRSLGTKTKCSISGSQLKSGSTKATRSKGGAKLASKDCNKR